MRRFVYADNAATTKLALDAFETMKPFLLDNFANASQPYSFSRKAKLALREAKEIIASCINCEPEEIYITSGGTESDNWAIKGITEENYHKRAIITSAFEHHAILNACKFVEQKGYPVAYLLPNSTGHITPESLRSIITKNTLLVSVMMANNEIGTVQNVQALAAIAHEHGALFHTDAVQAVGHIKIDVESMGIDMLSASAHKFNGPKGVGFLYISKDITGHHSLAVFHHGGQQENGLRAGTEDIASIVAMAVALKNNCSSIDNNMRLLNKFETMLLNGLNEKGVNFSINGVAPKLPGLLSMVFDDIEGETLLHRLDLLGVSVSTGAACDSQNTVISHVLQAIQLSEEKSANTIRISLGKYNTEEDIHYIVDAIVKVCNKIS